MSFKFAHNNINVLDLEKSTAFYQEALGLTEVKRKERDGYTLVFLGDDQTTHTLELTYIHDRTDPYDLGDNEIHLAFVTDDYEKAYAQHKKMGCICYENPKINVYFINDPDGYWLEILPIKK